MQLLRMHDLKMVKEELEQILQLPSDGNITMILVKTVRTIFDMYPILREAGLLDDFERLRQRAMQLKAMYPDDFKKVLDVFMRNVRLEIRRDISQVQFFNGRSNPVRDLNVCYLIRHFGCQEPFYYVSRESVEKAEQVFGDYDIAYFIDNWIYNGYDNTPELYKRFYEMIK